MSEYEEYRIMEETLGMYKESRHPLSYIMEAADDISYCTSDLEDGMSKRVFLIGELYSHLVSTISYIKTMDNYDAKDWFRVELAVEAMGNGYDGTYNPFYDFGAAVIRVMVDYCSEKYVNNQDKYMKGKEAAILEPNDSCQSYFMERMRNFAIEKLYKSSIVRTREITAYRVIHGILNSFKSCMTCKYERFSNILEGRLKDDFGNYITIEAGMVSKMPEKYKYVYKHYVERIMNGDIMGYSDTNRKMMMEWFARIHLIIDFISGMSDGYAMDMYRIVQGIDQYEKR